jgi:hypothetical protein
MNNQTMCRPNAALAFGVSACLLGALLMAAGESIFGADHAGIATIIGMVGLGVIVRVRRRMP